MRTKRLYTIDEINKISDKLAKNKLTKDIFFEYIDTQDAYDETSADFYNKCWDLFKEIMNTASSNEYRYSLAELGFNQLQENDLGSNSIDFEKRFERIFNTVSLICKTDELLKDFPDQLIDDYQFLKKTRAKLDKYKKELRRVSKDAGIALYFEKDR